MPTPNQNARGGSAATAPASSSQDMASPYYITTPSNQTEIVITGNKGEMSFTVTNNTAAALRTHFSLGRADNDGDSQRNPGLPEGSPLIKWLQIKTDGDPVPTVKAGNGTAHVSVTVAAPADAEGTYYFRLLAGAEPKPEEDFSASPTVTFKLSKTAVTPPPKIKWWIILVAVAGVLAIVGGVLFFVVRKHGMPDVVGKPSDEAKLVLEKAGLQVKISSVFSPGKPDGTVLDETPKAGDPLPDDKVVTLNVVSALPSVPCVEGMPLTAALAKLKTAGLQGTQQPYTGASSLSAGSVVLQNPRANICTPNAAGLKVAPNTPVLLQVKQ